MDDPIQKRLLQKFGNLPKWAEDFSIENAQDTRVSRRDFIRFLFLVSLGLFAGTFGVVVRSFFQQKRKAIPLVRMRIIGLEGIAVGDSFVFNIPGKHEPAILVRLAQDQFVAYAQKCTHLQCPVLWQKDQAKLICPCHHGAFSIETGEVLYGPPERPLPKIELEIDPDGVYFTGMRGGSMA